MPRCPGCFVPMTRTEQDGIKTHVCGNCFGTWLAPVALTRRVREDVAEAKANPARRPPPPLPKTATPPPLPNAAPSATVAAPPAPDAAPPAQDAAPTPDVAAEKTADNLAPNLPSLADLIDIVAESNNTKPLRCPECEKPMTKDRFQQMIPVTIDRCKVCDRIWLDTGKFNLIRRLYVEMTLSTDPQIIALREKIAGAQLGWQNRETLIDSVGHSAGASATGLDLTLRSLFSLLR